MKLDWTKIETVPLRKRNHLVRLETFGRPRKIAGMRDFLKTLPDQLAAAGLKRLVVAMREAREAGKPVIWGIGGHVVKTGLAAHLLALQEAGYVTALALTGAAAIHDFEIACCGETSEDVEAALAEGRFGVATETSQLMNDSVNEAYGTDIGLGEIWGRLIADKDLALPHADASLMASCVSLGCPVSVHPALGTDVTHFHPNCDWTALGKAAQHDFRRFTEAVADLDGGGVFVNVGSAVILPEVFLKAVAVVRNLGASLEGYVTANLDMLQHYRPRRNVLERTGADGIALTGHHEIMVPLLSAILLS